MAEIQEGRSGYAVCASPRSGSSYLCRLLASTGVLGNPREFFNNSALGPRQKYPDYPENPARQVDWVLRNGATPNGIYALKLFPNQFDAVFGFRVTDRLPDLRYVWLRRDDLLGQAISLLRARQTGQWGKRLPPTGAARYDRAALLECMRSIAEDDARWRVYFARNAIAPLDLTYRAVAGDPQSAVNAVAEFVGVPGRVEIDWSRVGATIMRDEQSEDWRRRFLSEMGDTGWLDVFPGSAPRQRTRRARARYRRMLGRLTGR